MKKEDYKMMDLMNSERDDEKPFKDALSNLERLRVATFHRDMALKRMFERGNLLGGWI